METFLIISLIVLTIATFFFLKELLVKFKFMEDFVNNSSNVVKWNYDGKRKPGMYNIVLKSNK